MGNHVHILVKVGIDTLSTAMKRLQLSYSSYYDRKYERSGYLFQDRFKSKPVDDNAYLLAVVRYIHRNPLEVGGRVDQWTSFSEYTGSPFITDTGSVLSMLADQECSAVDAFRELVEGSQGQNQLCGFEESHRISDSEAMEIICRTAAIGDCQQLCDMVRESQCRIIVELRAQGLSIRDRASDGHESQRCGKGVKQIDGLVIRAKRTVLMTLVGVNSWEARSMAELV